MQVSSYILSKHLFSLFYGLFSLATIKLGHSAAPCCLHFFNNFFKGPLCILGTSIYQTAALKTT